MPETNVFKTMRDAVDELCCAAFCLDQLARVAEGDDAVTPEELETAELTRIVDTADLGKFILAKLNRVQIEASRLERMAGAIDLGELWRVLRRRIDTCIDTRSIDASTGSAGTASTGSVDTATTE